MKVKIFPAILLIILIFIFYIFYKGLQNSNIYTPKTSINKSVPLFKAKIFDTNNTINSNEIFKSNKFYLLNIWSSWCIPCIDEHPLLINLSKTKDIEIIGINYKDKNKNAKNFLKKFESPYKIILSDKDGTISIELGAYGVPESFLIYDKKIVKKIIGPLDNNSLIELKEFIK